MIIIWWEEENLYTFLYFFTNLSLAFTRFAKLSKFHSLGLKGKNATEFQVWELVFEVCKDILVAFLIS